MHVYPDPASQCGHRMAVQGFPIPTPADNCINVSLFRMVTSHCPP